MTRIYRNDLGRAGPTLFLNFFVVVAPYQATKPHETNRADGMASDVAEILTAK